MAKIAILIDAELHNEVVLRTGAARDVTGFLERAIASYLDRTADDAELWSPAYIAGRQNRERESHAHFGPAGQGYAWQVLFLANGTRLRITYKGRPHFAEVRHGAIHYEGAVYSPSEWASHVASGTRRSAWRDIWVRRPGEGTWHRASALRDRERAAQRR